MKSVSYTAFLSSAKTGSSAGLKDQAKNIIQHFHPVNQTASRFAPTSFLLDYSTKKYIYVDASCFDLLGYSADYFLETGLEEYISKWHKDDFHILDTKVFCDSFSFLKTINPKNFADYIFSYNYRMLNAAGEYIKVLQRFSYISIGRQDPAGVIGVVFDITHYKNDTSIVHTIERSSVFGNSTENELVFKKIHPVLSRENSCLSKKEKEILRFIAQGLPSKHIADEMDVSTNTVNNHRRNMLAKTGCHSSSELITYAVRNGLL
jgi:DNA-binding CsgD family transcriptional regulator